MYLGCRWWRFWVVVVEFGDAMMMAEARLWRCLREEVLAVCGRLLFATPPPLLAGRSDRGSVGVQAVGRFAGRGWFLCEVLGRGSSGRVKVWFCGG
ncbi:hypothetical protein M758_12G143800 [Ceratodon purpureus]|nr:hypothetical protein M758_12G143800 [Ceratodon purpureus]